MGWMRPTKLKLNPDQAEAVLVGSSSVLVSGYTLVLGMGLH